MSGEDVWERREAARTGGWLGRRGMSLVSGEGCLVRDGRGEEYLDLTSGHGVLALGHGHPRVQQAVREGAADLLHVGQSYAHPQRAAYLEELCALLPGDLDRAFLSNSGTEAVETALRLAVGACGRSRILALRRGFHGRTLGALSLTFNPRYRRGVEGCLLPVDHISADDPQAFEGRDGSPYAALFLELVQGEGGVHLLSPDWVAQARAWSEREGVLLVVDEVQTGLGRTGTFWACQHYGLQPDILCASKALAAGLPLGVTAWSPRLTPPEGLAGSTLGGNPLSCRVGRVVLGELTRPGFLEGVLRRGAEWRRRLEGAPLVERVAVRGLGFMLGVECRRPVAPLIARLAREHRMLVLNAGPRTIRVLPPLILSGEEEERMLRGLESVLGGVSWASN